MRSNNDANIRPGDQTRCHHRSSSSIFTAMAILIVLCNVACSPLSTHAFPTPSAHRALAVKGGAFNVIGGKSLCGDPARATCSRRYSILYGSQSSSDDAASSDQLLPSVKEQQKEPAEENEGNEEKEKLDKEMEDEIQAVAEQINQEKEEFQAAVQGVKEAVGEVSQSAKNLGGAVVNHGPGIFSRFFTLLVSVEMRYDKVTFA